MGDLVMKRTVFSGLPEDCSELLVFYLEHLDYFYGLVSVDKMAVLLGVLNCVYLRRTFFAVYLLLGRNVLAILGHLLRRLIPPLTPILFAG